MAIKKRLVWWEARCNMVHIGDTDKPIVEDTPQQSGGGNTCRRQQKKFIVRSSN